MQLSLEQLERVRGHFGERCEEVQVEGDEPLLLDDPAWSYLTQVAHHQLFCVGYRDGAPVGRREHVALCTPGQLLLGRSPEPGDTTVLLLSGIAGSKVLRIPSAEFFAALREPSLSPLIAGAFDGWIELLISTLPSSPVPTRCDALVAGATLEAIAAPVRARDGVVWALLSQPPTRHGGVKLPTSGDVPTCWPITPTEWLVADGADAEVLGSAELIQVRGRELPDRFYTFVLTLLSEARASIESKRLEQDALSRKFEGRFVSDSLGKLALVGRGERLAPDLERDDALEAVCARIAHFLELPPLAVPRPAGTGLSHFQTALSRLTGARIRKVLLEGAWYEHDAGPLLGFEIGAEDALSPVALLPGKSGYEVFRSGSAAPEPVTSTLAETLHPQAHQFYAAFPDRPIRPFDVLRFSAKRAHRDIVFVLGVGMALGSFATLIPLLTGQVFDTLIPGAERGLLLQLTLVIAFVYLGQALFDVARGYALIRAQTRMDATLEAGIWDRLLGLPLPFFREYSAGDLASRAAGIGGIREVLAGTTLSALLGGIFAVWNFGFLFIVDSALALAATVLVAGAIVPALIGTYFALKRERVVAEVDGKIEGLLLQLLNGIAKLRVAAAENRAFAVWAGLFAKRRDADLGAEWVNVRLGVFHSVYPVVCSIVLYWMLAGTGEQKLSTGMFLAFSSAFGMFLGSTLGVVGAALGSLSVVPMFERAKPILSARMESQGGGQRVELVGAIEVNHVSFRYDPKGPLILDDVSIQIEAGQFVALVGPSGSGKSTLLRLMLGFETPSEGGVFYDGQALGGIDVRVLRKQTGVVMQNSRVMAGDVFSNIVGATGLTQEDAWRAARKAALDKDIEAMPMGMQTVITQGGGTLSGGQRQRLLIARALAFEPKILFFDEATSALDNVTQAAVSQSLETMRVTRVVIAHRLSTIQHADKIVVMERGRVVQTGRFDDLIQVEGAFRELARRQMV
ncbi:MAG: NHLP bacteriocin export ABC transporter permease/ATPase subunit [Polyangiaceae bacterium]|nr:NHLP bacteriocin export ABC transporter permease/ATPase subunit [Polyangiaceae bacterium]